MRIIASVVIFSVLGGCSTIDKAIDLWPRAHDPAMAGGFVELQQKIDKIDCLDKSSVNEAIFAADWLNKYAFFRNDPQRVTTNLIIINLNKAAAAEEAACKRWVNLANINMKTLQKSWGSR